MSKEKKISVRTPAAVYEKLIQRAFQLDLTHREYYLALALQDLGLAEEGEEMDKVTATKLKKHIKSFDNPPERE